MLQRHSSDKEAPGVLEERYHDAMEDVILTGRHLRPLAESTARTRDGARAPSNSYQVHGKAQLDELQGLNPPQEASELLGFSYWSDNEQRGGAIDSIQVDRRPILCNPAWPARRTSREPGSKVHPTKANSRGLGEILHTWHHTVPCVAPSSQLTSSRRSHTIIV